MKPIISILLICLIASLTFGQEKSELPGVIFSAKQSTSDEWSPFNGHEGTWTPLKSEVIELEHLLPDWIASNKHPNAKEIFSNLKSYKRQYLGYVENGKRYIYVNAFCGSFAKDNKYWKKQFVVVMDGGACFFQIVYDPATKAFSKFSVNGVA